MSHYTYQSVMLLFDLSKKALVFGALWQNGLKPYETASLREACPSRDRGSIGHAIPLLVGENSDHDEESADLWGKIVKEDRCA
jgi:hypothetical protein